MSRPGKRAADLGFASITIEGGLISPEQITAIASATPDQKTAAEYGCDAARRNHALFSDRSGAMAIL